MTKGVPKGEGGTAGAYAGSARPSGAPSRKPRRSARVLIAMILPGAGGSCDGRGGRRVFELLRPLYHSPRRAVKRQDGGGELPSSRGRAREDAALVEQRKGQRLDPPRAARGRAR